MIYKLVGYDPETEVAAVEREIPAPLVERAKAAAGIWARPEIVGDWPLSKEQAGTIDAMIGARDDIRRFDWFLEPYAEPLRAAG